MENIMMSKGFIVGADLRKGGDSDTTDLHVEDGVPGAPNDDITVSIWIAEKDFYLDFTRPEAEAFVEAINEILKRYPRNEAQK